MTKQKAGRLDAAGDWLAAQESEATATPRPNAKRPKRSRADMIRERDAHWFLLRVEGYTYREIAARSNVTHAAVHAAIRRIPDPVKAQLRSRILATG